MEEKKDRQRRKVIQEIDRYLMERENDGDGEAQVLHLLGAAKEALEEVGEEGEREKTDIILSTFENIQQKLTRVEEQGTHTQQAGKIIYAAVVQNRTIMT